MYRYNNSSNQVVDPDKEFVETTLSKIFKFFFTGGFFKIVAYLFIFMGGLFWSKEFITSRSYVKTIGTFEEYTSCSDGVCGNRYSYVVDGKTYYVSSDLQSDTFPEKDNVYYNPKNPSEAMMFSSWHILFITGVVMIVGMKFLSKKTRSILAGGTK